MSQHKGNRDSKRNKPASRNKLRARRGDDGSWELVHPRCAVVRAEDLDEVQQMIAAGEAEIARDELRWLVSECRDFIAAHKLLGDLALAEGDLRLARGHYGYAYQLGLKAIDSAVEIGTLRYEKPTNRLFFEAGRGLAICLSKAGKRGLAKDVIVRLQALDPSDPLQLHRSLEADGQSDRGARGSKRGKQAGRRRRKKPRPSGPG